MARTRKCQSEAEFDSKSSLLRVYTYFSESKFKFRLSFQIQLSFHNTILAHILQLVQVCVSDCRASALFFIPGVLKVSPPDSWSFSHHPPPWKPLALDQFFLGDLFSITKFHMNILTIRTMFYSWETDASFSNFPLPSTPYPSFCPGDI